MERGFLLEQPCSSFFAPPSSTTGLRRTRYRRSSYVLPLASYKPERCSGIAGRVSGRRKFEPGFEFVPSATTATEYNTVSGAAPRVRGRASNSPKGKKLRVAVDVDEVLGRFVHRLNEFCQDEYGLEYDVSDYHVYDFAKVWRCSQDESNHKVHEFFKSNHFSQGIEVIPGSFESLQRLKSVCELVVVTSRQHIIQQPTIDWLDTHFPHIFDDVHFGNHFALEGTSRKKSEICRAVGAHVLIDDNPNYAMECAAEGISVLLYDWQNGYPWSKTAEGPTHDRITRVTDWEEVEQVLGVLSDRVSAGV